MKILSSRFAGLAMLVALASCRPGFGALTGSAWTDGHGHVEAHVVPVDPMQPLGPKQFDLHWHIGEGLGSTVVGMPPIFSRDFEADEIYPVIPLVSNSNFNRPAGASWDFTGTTTGSQLFVIPLVVPPANEVLPRLGLASDLVLADWVGGNLTYQFNLLGPAPGHLSIFDGDSTTPIPLYSSFGGAPANFLQQPGGHYHHNYAFTAPGIYEVELIVSGTHITDGPITGSNTFQFFVGDVSAIPEPTSPLLLVAAILSLAVPRRRLWLSR